ncbi:MAG: methionyl-tRNA formyltransferase [Salinisphaeraceae bacterium]|jgi:methionyl-tRNA formyltransferase|nr:methionyl-tRNA formyltransferase [Salinisphaeraceae bacterium]
MRIVFAGTPEFAVPSLRAMLESDHQVVGVLTQPDRPAGRGRQPRPSPVKGAALASGLPVYQPLSLKKTESLNTLAQWAPDLMVVVAYGLLLPADVLSLPEYGCINVHASLLPRWRGAAPIARCIQAGDQETGVTIMQMDRGLDTGDMLAQQACELTPAMTAGQLHDRLAEMGAGLLRTTVSDLVRGRVSHTPQDHDQACYARRLAKQEAQVDWTRHADAIARDIRAFNPWPVCHARLDGKAIRLFQAAVGRDREGHAPGEIISADDDGIVVACGQGSLTLRTLQWPGKKPVAAADAARGRKLAGQRFE